MRGPDYRCDPFLLQPQYLLQYLGYDTMRSLACALDLPVGNLIFGDGFLLRRLYPICAEVSEPVDEHDLGSCAFGRVGSSPTFRTTPTMPRRRNTQTQELDLHGLSWPEARRQFIDFYNNALASGKRRTRLEIIHGWGASGQGGVLRNRLRRFLVGCRDSLEFTPGEDADGNRGCTYVTPLEPLPDANNALAEAIWDFCRRPRAMSKVAGQFRRHGDPQVLAAVRYLKKQGRLIEIQRGRSATLEAR